MSNTGDFLTGIILFFLFGFGMWVLPIIVSGRIAEAKGRTKSKAWFITVFTGWVGTMIIWLFLKDINKHK